jgi:hypothetical protein
VVGVALGIGVEELAERVAATGVGELMARLLRGARSFAGRTSLIDAQRVAEIMEV